MSTKYTVVKGDCLSAIAKRHGFADYRTIYNHPENAEFKKLRPDPNLIYPGDILRIPDKDPGEKPGGTEKKHKFKKKGKKTFLLLRIKDSEDKAFANVEYELTIDDKDAIKGTTDGGGKLEEEIDAAAAKGELILKSKSGTDEIIGVIELELGQLDPIEQDTGVQARLNNLGFDSGDVDGNLTDDQAKAALLAFQKKNTLTESGTADQATKNKLVALHDWE